MIIFLLLLLVPNAQSQSSCSSTGEWTTWSEWTACPRQTTSLMNFRARLRTCEPRPVGCRVERSYSCSGTYSEVVYCTDPDPVSTTESIEAPINTTFIIENPTPTTLVSTTSTTLVSSTSTTLLSSTEPTAEQTSTLLLTTSLEPELSSASATETSTIAPNPTITTVLTTLSVTLPSTRGPIARPTAPESREDEDETTAAVDIDISTAAPDEDSTADSDEATTNINNYDYDDTDSTSKAVVTSSAKAVTDAESTGTTYSKEITAQTTKITSESALLDDTTQLMTSDGAEDDGETEANDSTAGSLPSTTQDVEASGDEETTSTVSYNPVTDTANVKETTTSTHQSSLETSGAPVTDDYEEDVNPTSKATTDTAKGPSTTSTVSYNPVTDTTTSIKETTTSTGQSFLETSGAQVTDYVEDVNSTSKATTDAAKGPSTHATTDENYEDFEGTTAGEEYTDEVMTTAKAVTEAESAEEPESTPHLSSPTGLGSDPTETLTRVSRAISTFYPTSEGDTTNEGSGTNTNQWTDPVTSTPSFTATEGSSRESAESDTEDTVRPTSTTDEPEEGRSTAEEPLTNPTTTQDVTLNSLDNTDSTPNQSAHSTTHSGQPISSTDSLLTTLVEDNPVSISTIDITSEPISLSTEQVSSNTDDSNLSSSTEALPVLTSTPTNIETTQLGEFSTTVDTSERITSNGSAATTESNVASGSSGDITSSTEADTTPLEEQSVTAEDLPTDVVSNVPTDENSDTDVETATANPVTRASEPVTTTATPICDDCPELNVHLYDDDPFEDGASVLNRYSVRGCKFVQFFCRPFEAGDERPVRTLFNRNASIDDLPLNVDVACRNGQWYDQERNLRVNSLSCIYEPPTTTTVTTTTTTETMTTTFAPGDPNNPCNQCNTEVYVSPRTGQEGSTYMDFRFEECLSVQLFCQPLKSSTYVDLLENGQSVELTGNTVNRTLVCTEDTEWMDTRSQLIISNVTCQMRDGQF